MVVKMPHWPKRINNNLIELDLTLSRLSELLNRLGNPQNKMPPMIHIAGTNGKGSTLSFIYRILVEAGYTVHTLTSPHLLYFNERIHIANKQIDDEFLFEVMEECRVAAGNDLVVSFFEGMTAGAYLAFSKVKADFIIVEVGLGGLGDATNVVDDSLLSVITPISFDHTEFLGDTIEEIALAKAGIMKPNKECVIGYQEYQGALNALQSYAKLKNVELSYGGIDWGININEDTFDFTHIDKTTMSFNKPSLRGNHQCYNAATAIATTLKLRDKYNYNITESHIEKALKNTNWPFRLESMTQGKITAMLPEKWEIILDGAHNSGGAYVLADWIKTYAKNRKVYMIFGTTRGKAMDDFLINIKDVIDDLYAICVRSEPRASLAQDIINSTIKLNIKANQCEYLKDALLSLKTDHENEEEAVIIICGSLFLAGDILDLEKTL